MVKMNIIERTDKLLKGEKTINPAYKNKEVAQAIAAKEVLDLQSIQGNLGIDLGRFYEFLNHKEQSELRLIEPDWKNKNPEDKIIQKWCNNKNDFLNIIKEFNGKRNIYVGINERKKGGDADKDVKFITNIGHDIDAHDSDEDLGTASIIALKIKDDAVKKGYKEPMVLCSGRGFWVIHHIHPIPNTPENIKKIKEFGKRIKSKYEKGNIELDSTVYNPSRIARVPGTLNISDEKNQINSFIVNKPSGEEDFKLADDILDIEIPKYVNASSAKSPKDSCAFLDYCLAHEIPKGERHKTISRNMSLYICDNPDRELLEEQYYKIQKGSELELKQWLKNIDENGKEKYPFSCGELITFQMKYEIPFKCRGCPKLELYKKEKAKKDEPVLLEDFLIITYKDNGDVKNKKVNVDKFAHYLKEKQNFKTIFGKNKDYVFSYDGKIFKPNGRGVIKTKCEELLTTFASRYVVDEIFEKIKRLTEINIEEFESTDINLIPLENGVWNIKLKKLIPYKPEYNFQFIINIKKDSEAKCPNWDKFLEETFYPENIKLIQEWFGFNLYREYFIKKGIICVGIQDTGKSVFLDTITKFIGEKNKTGMSLQKLTSGSDFTKLSLKNKHSNIYDDLSSKDVNDGGAFKIATGGGYISGEEKFGEFSQFRSFAKHTFATNKIPPVKDNDDLAYFGRWIILKFDNVPKKIDPFLRNKLWTEEEMSGVLNWALKGLYRLLDTGKFSYDKTSEEIKAVMEESGCPLVLFSNEVLINEDGNIITKDDMYKVYSIWAKTSKKPRLSKEQLGRQLEKYCYYILADKHKERIWKNARINKDWYEKNKLHINNDTYDTSQNNMRTFLKPNNKQNNNSFLLCNIIKNKVSEVSQKKGLKPSDNDNNKKPEVEVIKPQDFNKEVIDTPIKKVSEVSQKKQAPKLKGRIKKLSETIESMKQDNFAPKIIKDYEKQLEDLLKEENEN